MKRFLKIALVSLGMLTVVVGVLIAIFVPIPGSLPPGDTEIGRMARSGCKTPVYRGSVGYVDCGAEVDGPAYYFDRSSGKIISDCGNFCMNGCENCPPPSWGRAIF